MSPSWPALPYESWRDTLATLHRYFQIAGKIRLELTPLTNHFWNVAFQLASRGFSSGATPYRGRTFDLDFDLVAHRLHVGTSEGEGRTLPLGPRSVAHFRRDLFTLLADLGIHVRINEHPVEILNEVIPFPEDRLHASYDRDAVSRCWRILSQSAVIFEEFRARFLGKASPVHFFWGSFDLAASRFSGRRAPLPAGANLIYRESYSHEVISAGFWPGDPRFPAPAYYAYCVPLPAGLATVRVRPAGAYWHPALGNFLLPYDLVRTSADPRATLLDFLQSTYDAAADLARWPRAELERHPPSREPLPPEPPPAPPPG